MLKPPFCSFVKKTGLGDQRKVVMCCVCMCVLDAEHDHVNKISKEGVHVLCLAL